MVNTHDIIHATLQGLRENPSFLEEVSAVLFERENPALSAFIQAGLRQESGMLTHEAREMIKILNWNLPSLADLLDEVPWNVAEAAERYRREANEWRIIAGTRARNKAPDGTPLHSMIVKGPELWKTLHTWATAWNGVIEDRDNFLKEFTRSLPCRTCQSHWAIIVREYPPPDEQYRLFWWTVDLHNKVNRKLGKDEFPDDQASATYL